MKRITRAERVYRLQLLDTAISAATVRAEQLCDEIAGIELVPIFKIKEAALRISTMSNESLTEYFLHYPTRAPGDKARKYASGPTNTISAGEEEPDIAHKVGLLNDKIYEVDQLMLARRIADLVGGRFPDMLSTDDYDHWSFALGNFSLLVLAAKAREHIRGLNREAAGSLMFNGRSVSEEYNSLVAFLLDEEASERALARRSPDSTFK